VMVVILQVKKSDGTFISGTTPTQSQSVAANVNNTLFGVFNPSTKKTVAGLWESCSYNKLGIAYDVDGKSNNYANSKADIFVVSIPHTCTAGKGYCKRSYNSATCSSNGNEFYGWSEYAFKVLAARGVSKSMWQHTVFVYPRSTGMGCQFVGTGTVGCTSSYCSIWVAHDYVTQVQNYAHEFGHNLGLTHSGDATASATATGNLEYGDFSCAMGYCCSTRCYNAPQAVKLGWMTPIATFSSSNLAAGQSVTLNLPSMTRSSNGVIRIALNWGSGQNYWLQYKLKEKYDSSILTGWTNVVGIKKWNKTTSEKISHLANLAVSQAWTDPSGDVTIHVNALDATKGIASVTVTRNL
jgi:hypothetical protein